MKLICVGVGIKYELNMNNIHTLIIPDVHGRIFWKDAINKFPINEYPEINIVFLGIFLILPTPAPSFMIVR